MLISIHAPREGSDVEPALFQHPIEGFLSTLPVRGATRGTSTKTAVNTLFLSTLPRGERPQALSP